MADAGISEAANKLQDLKVTEGAAPADKPAKSPKAAKKAKKGGDMQLKLSPEPEFIHHRVQMFDELKAEYDAFVAAQPRVPIKLSLPDGRDMDGTAWETTPMDIAKSISKSLSERVVISQVDGVSWDLLRPLEQSCKLALLDFDDDEGKRVFWHSSAHVLGEASELHFGCHLCIGPPIEEGFFYEMALPEMANVEETSHEPLVKLAKAAIAEKQPFVRLVVSKENLLKMFKHNKYKQHIINDKIPDGTSTTVYRCGPLIDLCAGPHIPHTGKIKAFAVTKNSASYFLGNQENDSLQRIYGISFPEAKMMKEWQQFMEDAAKRDHRRIGTEQDLFFFHELSPGSCFFFPNGTKIYNKLMDLQKSEYRKRGFSEVITPNMYNTKLWDVSGHNINYAENMFGFEVEKERFALKPMNCMTADHQLLTDEGFIGIDQLVERLAPAGSKILVACYSTDTKKLEYHAITSADVIDRAELGDVVNFKHNGATSNDVDLRVTADHEMFVARGRGTDYQAYGKTEAKNLVSQDGLDQLKLLAHASQGAEPRVAEAPRVFASLGLNDETVPAFLELYGYWLGDGSLDKRGYLVFTPSKKQDVAYLDSLLARLNLVRGASLGDGDYWRQADHDAAGQLRYQLTNPVWYDVFVKQSAVAAAGGDAAVASVSSSFACNMNVDVVEKAKATKADGPEGRAEEDSKTEVESPEPLSPEIKSAKWLWQWALRSLDAQQLRHLLVGLRFADGDQSNASNPNGGVIFTSSARFRDEVVLLCLHAGYAVNFGQAQRSDVAHHTNQNGAPIQANHPEWAVSYSDAPQSAEPTIIAHRDVEKGPYDGRVWCVTVPHRDHLIMVRRVTEVKDGAVMKASKPVIIGNCPGHCLMFKQRDRSYRELPIRFADFGVLHRNEASGALTGLTRVRRFQQDDAHIFCTLAQLEGEMKGCLDFLQHIYGIFGFTFHLKLSTRPDKFLGEIETWDRVEKILADALNAFGHKWELNPGDGAFYGPKIDIVVSDALRRKFQCATIQLDAQLPERFELQYRTDSPENPYARPIIIHRAILGSIERMMAILAENYAGKWPFWLSPFQALVIPVAAPHFEYAEQVRQQLHDAGIDATVDLSDLTLNKKIRNGEIAHYNFIMVVGSDEAETQTVNLRNRDDVGSKGKGQVRPLTIVIEKLLALLASKSLTQDIQFE